MPSATHGADASAVRVWLPAFTAVGAAVKGQEGCRRAMQVELSIQGEVFSGAMLADHGEGRCEDAVAPNRRFYELRPVANECGAQVYAGQVSGPEGASHIKLTDHSRSHGCAGSQGDGFVIEIEERVAGHGPERYVGDWHG
jgi:hypothetical protein